MITEEQLKKIGFENDGITKSPFTGKLCGYRLYRDNGHIITGHDSMEILLNLEHPFATIEIDHRSSYQSGKGIVFRGRCEDIELFKQILNAVIGYYK